MIEAVKNNDLQGERKAEELMQRLKRTLYAKGDDIAEDVDSSLEELQRSIENLEDSITTEEEVLNSFGDAEPVWERISKYINYLYQNEPAPRHVLNGAENSFPEDLELRPGERKYNVAKLYNDLQDLYQKHLLPVNQALEDGEVGERAPLKKISENAKNTVRAHQYLHEYKQIIRIALEDEELRGRMIEDLDDSGVGNLADEVWGQVEDLETFNERLDQVEQKEKDILEALEEARSVLQRKTQLDENMIREIVEEFFPEEDQDSGGFLSRVTGSNQGKMASEKFRQVLQEYESMQDELQSSGIGRIREALGESEDEAKEDLEDIQGVLHFLRGCEEIVEQNIMPTVERIREEEELDEKLDKKLISELEEYVEEHRQLFEGEESADEIFEDAEEAAQEDMEEGVGQMLQGVEMETVGGSAVEAFERRVSEGGGPPGDSDDPRWRMFHENLTELIEMKRNGEFGDIREELEDIEEGYNNIYRVEEDQQDVIEDFEGEMKDIKSNMEEVMADIKGLGEYDMDQLRSSDGFGRGQVDEIIDDLKQSRQDLERMRADLMKTREFGNQEESSFELIRSRIEEVVQRTSNIQEDVENLVQVVGRLKDETIGERGASEYADALMLSAMEIYGEQQPDELLKDDLLGEIGEMRRSLEEIGELESRLKDKDHEEVEIEEQEIREIYRLVEGIKGKNGIYTEIKNEINPKDLESIDKAVSGDVADAISGIASNLDRIAEILREAVDQEEIVIEEAKEEEAELEDAYEASRRAAGEARNLEESIGEEVDRMEDEFEDS